MYIIVSFSKLNDEISEKLFSEKLKRSEVKIAVLCALYGASTQKLDVILNSQFNAGDVIWNTSEDVLQVWTGQEWLNISTPTTKGVGATGAVSALTVSVNGATTVPLL